MTCCNQKRQYLLLIEFSMLKNLRNFIKVDWDAEIKESGASSDVAHLIELNEFIWMLVLYHVVYLDAAKIALLQLLPWLCNSTLLTSMILWSLVSSHITMDFLVIPFWWEWLWARISKRCKRCLTNLFIHQQPMAFI